MRVGIGLVLLGVWLVGCEAEPPRSPPEVIFARFDPTASKIPMPTDFLRDDATGYLKLTTTDATLTPADKELRTFLNTLKGWPASSSARVELSGQLAPNSVTAETVQVWIWQGTSVTRHRSAKLVLSTDGKQITIEPPAEGWPRGATVVVALRGGARGVMGAKGETVECDAAFYFLRLKLRLNAHPDFRAFPGQTRAEREKAARDLETLRAKLARYFVDLEKRGLPRQEIAALWHFTTNDHTEVLMDSASGRMPLPIDLLLDSQTGKVDLPERSTDSARDKQIKKDLRVLDGFSTTAGQLFELSAAVDPKTLSSTTVELYRVKDAAPVAATAAVDTKDLTRVEITPTQVPLDAGTTYAVVLRSGILDGKGRAVQPMLVGHFLKAAYPLTRGGKSEVSSLDDSTARTLEWARQRVSPLLDRIGRKDVLVAWPFTTLHVAEPLLQAMATVESSSLPYEPTELVERTAAKAALEFPIGALAVLRVKKVFEGKIATADYLDPVTRRAYADGSHQVRWVPFTMTIPDSAEASTPLPVVVFGHAICTERRFVLAMADGLAKRGFAAISIDFPYHGSRTHCAWNGPMCFPDPLSKDGAMICPSPCPSGATCGTDGKCRDKSGIDVGLSTWPVLPLYQASGAAFIDLSSIGGTMEHFRQAVIDLAALSRALRKGSWKTHIGYTLKTDAIYYLGQSLGGILGGTYVGLDPYVERAVLNVPGANLVPMFQDSKYFGAHIDAYLKRESIQKGTAEYQRFLHVARWFMDAVDPINVAQYLVKQPIPGETENSRKVMIQMATLDFIIPNESTKKLASLAGVPRKDYVAEHAFLAIPVEPAYGPGIRDAADFLFGSLSP